MRKILITAVVAAAAILYPVAPAGAATAAPSCLAAPNDVGVGFLLHDGKYRDIAVPGAVYETLPTDITNAGRVVGAYYDPGGTVHGFDLDGKYRAFDHPAAGAGPGLGSSLTRVNASGTMIGLYDDPANACHSFVRTASGKLSEIRAGAFTQALGLNDRGQIAGLVVDDAGAAHGFVLTGGTLRQLDVPGAIVTGITDINDAGQVVGIYSTDGVVTHGFLAGASGVTTIDPPGAAGTTLPFGVDGFGRVVGYYADQAGVRHGFRYAGGRFATIDHPAAVDVTQAQGLNDRGDIVGFYGRSGPASTAARTMAMTASTVSGWRSGLTTDSA